jgi:hypothetical protein
VWDQWVSTIMNRFVISQHLDGLRLPEHFPTRCLLAVCYLCAIRNAIKHSFTRMGASDPAPLYRWNADGRIYIEKTTGGVAGWPTTILAIRNYCPEAGRSPNADGTARAVSFYLGELKKCLGITQQFPFENRFVGEAYLCHLPLIVDKGQI